MNLVMSGNLQVCILEVWSRGNAANDDLYALVQVDGKGIGQMGFSDEAAAQAVVQRLRDAQLKVRAPDSHLVKSCRHLMLLDWLDLR